MKSASGTAIDLVLPYITEDLPGIGGKLRTSPDHFVVEELPLYPAQGAGQHLYVNLTKTGLTTREVQAQLSDLFQLPRSAVGFAGMKDKYARTTQTFSLEVGHVGADFVATAANRIGEHLPVIVNWAGLHKNKLKPGHLLGNRFAIVVTELTLPPAEALEQANTIAQWLRVRGLPNYFGPQRLGVDGENVRRGLAIVQGRGESDKQDRWLHRFLISSYQSHLCNCYLARRVHTGRFDRILAGDIAKKHDTGGLFEVADVAAEQPRYVRGEISFTAPVYGHKMWPTSGEAGELEGEILDEAGVTMDQLRRARVEGTRRLGRLLVPDLQVSALPQGLTACFSLPKGAFATTVLREIMKVADKELASFSSDGD